MNLIRLTGNVWEFPVSYKNLIVTDTTKKIVDSD